MRGIIFGIIGASLFLGGCAQIAAVKAAAPIVKATVGKVLDAKMDLGRVTVCNAKYDVESRARKRWGNGGAYNAFCGRLDGPGR